MIPLFLLPGLPDAYLEGIDFDQAAAELTLMITITQQTAHCPVCAGATDRVHSRYTRTLLDLPWADVLVRLRLQVRKFFCRTPTCPRAIFTERLPTLAAPWARRTLRLADLQGRIGLALGGIAGARLAAALHLPASRDTLLRLVRRTLLASAPPPRVIGVDEWAHQKGRRYGTIVVDLERGRTIDLLPDQAADTFTHWLRDHPGVEVISRDRAEAYAEGATAGAPDAIQVADRFHLLRNLLDALIEVLEPYHAQIQQAGTTSQAGVREPAPAELANSPDGDTNPLLAVAAGVLGTPAPTRAEQAATHRRARRVARYDAVCALHHQGWSMRAIADHLGLNRATVSKFIHAPTFPERQPRVYRSRVLEPYKPYLIERWNAGCHVGAQLLRSALSHLAGRTPRSDGGPMRSTASAALSSRSSKRVSTHVSTGRPYYPASPVRRY